MPLRDAEHCARVAWHRVGCTLPWMSRRPAHPHSQPLQLPAASGWRPWCSDSEFVRWPPHQGGDGKKNEPARTGHLVIESKAAIIDSKDRERGDHRFWSRLAKHWLTPRQVLLRLPEAACGIYRDAKAMRDPWTWFFGAPVSIQEGSVGRREGPGLGGWILGATASSALGPEPPSSYL